MAPSSTSSKGSLLPFDILESILYRVPAHSLNRFKLVCKRWFNLLKDKRFIYNHLNLVQQHFIHLSDIVRIINPETNVGFTLPHPDFRVRYTDFEVRSYKTIIMHCDGLLLCVTNGSNKLAVWNPLFNQVKWISKPFGSYSSTDTYGFGYDSKSRDNYKILRFGRDIYNNEYKPTFEIYEFKSSSWRSLDTPLDRVIYHSDKGVSVKGNMYWIVKSKLYIQCFDFSTETFKSICLFPFYIDNWTYDFVALSAYKEDKLSLLCRCSKLNQPDVVEVWITNNVEERVVSWIKLIVVSSHDLPMLRCIDSSRYIQYFIDRNIMINVMSSEDRNFNTNGNLCIFLNVHTIGMDGFKTKKIGRYSPAGIRGYVYLPSLVSVL